MESEMDCLLNGHLTRRQLHELKARGVLNRSVLQQLKVVGSRDGLPAMHKAFHELLAERPILNSEEG